MNRILALIAVATAVAGCASPSATRPVSSRSDEYAFWPPAPNEPRVQFLRAFRFSSDVEPPQSTFDKLVFGSEAQVLPIAKPYGVEMWKGRIYVCDINNPAVVILDLVKRQTRLMQTRGVEPMVQPTDIAIAPDGMKYVIDRRLGRVFVFDADDRHAVTFGEKDLVPAGVAVHGDELFIPDLQAGLVRVLDRFHGEERRTIGGGEGDFVRPLGVHVDGDGAVYVTDAIRGRVQKYDREGRLLKTLGELGDGPGSFVRPKHVAVDDEGLVYVVDAAFQNVQMFNAEGELLMYFGGPGQFPGSMSLPAGVSVHRGDLELFAGELSPAFEARGLLLVTNQFGLNKVAVYALGRLREGYTMADILPYRADIEPDRTVHQAGRAVGAGSTPQADAAASPGDGSR